jgi:HPt (histidine-containing phosphotransfer) domain-containing protein
MDAPTDLAVLDRAALQAIRDLDPTGQAGLFSQIVGMYVQSVPPLIEQIESGLAEGDAQRVVIAAHTLKSSSANLGSQHLSRTCAGLEAAARRGTLDGQAGIGAQIRREFEAVQRALEHEVRAPHKPG